MTFLQGSAGCFPWSPTRSHRAWNRGWAATLSQSGLRVGAPELRIELQGAFVVVHSRPHRVNVELALTMESSKEFVVGLEVRVWRGSHLRIETGGQGPAQSCGHPGGEGALELEELLQPEPASQGLRPYVFVVEGVDELGGEDQAVLGHANATLEDISDAQSFRRLPRWNTSHERR